VPFRHRNTEKEKKQLIGREEKRYGHRERRSLPREHREKVEVKNRKGRKIGQKRSRNHFLSEGGGKFYIEDRKV